MSLSFVWSLANFFRILLMTSGCFNYEFIYARAREHHDFTRDFAHKHCLICVSTSAQHVVVCHDAYITYIEKSTDSRLMSFVSLCGVVARDRMYTSATFFDRLSLSDAFFFSFLETNAPYILYSPRWVSKPIVNQIIRLTVFLVIHVVVLYMCALAIVG